jgi:hypothetical protein
MSQSLESLRTPLSVGQPPPAFSDHPAGAMKHQSMNFQSGSRGVIEKRIHVRRIDADFTRLAPFQSVYVGHITRPGFCHFPSHPFVFFCTIMQTTVSSPSQHQ